MTDRTTIWLLVRSGMRVGLGEIAQWQSVASIEESRAKSEVARLCLESGGTYGHGREAPAMPSGFVSPRLPAAKRPAVFGRGGAW